MLRVPLLTDAQIRDYDRDGFVVLRAAFDAAEMQRINASRAGSTSSGSKVPGYSAT